MGFKKKFWQIAVVRSLFCLALPITPSVAEIRNDLAVIREGEVFRLVLYKSVVRLFTKPGSSILYHLKFTEVVR